MLKLKHAFQQGQTLVGTWLNAPSPAQAETIGYAGFDFVILDTEHSSYDIPDCENLVRAADAAGLPSLIRVPENRGTPVGKALEYGAQGIVVPHVSTKAEAEAAVNHAHYPPKGVRGAAPTVRGAHYGQTPWPDYLAQARAETLVVLQIEGKEGIENLDAIMGVAGVDVLFIGPFDLSGALGISGQLDHPLLLDTAGDIVRRARSRHMAVGIWMPTPEQVGPWIARGVQMITVASNDMIFMQACRTVAGKVKAQIPGRA
ncbi:MAG: aldolase/citrate lyase family protein [Anaerolineae bacterium]